MPYTTEDLSVFDCSRDRSRLQGTSYFEFHAGERPSDHACWLDGSLFIRDAGFDFFAELFYQTVPGFDYFSFVEVEPQAIGAVVRGLDEFSRRISSSSSREAVFSYYSSLFSADIWAEVPASDIAPRLRRACDGIREYCHNALQAHQPLCILGM
jgi:hypothetical protein